MKTPSTAPAHLASAPVTAEEARLRQAARDLEGVFLAELVKAMRESIPEDGLTGGGMGEEIFTSLLDQHLAPQVGEGWTRGIADSLYRQLRGHVAPPRAEEGA